MPAGVFGADGDGLKVAATEAGHAFPTRPRDEALANARLIASAPELVDLAKLFAASSRFQIRQDQQNGDDEGARLKSITLAQVDAVLLAATGEACS